MNENFEKWFGASKVVDSNGNPLKLYHGSHQAGFDTFQLGATSMTYFTPDPEYASAYTHPSMSAITKTGKQPTEVKQGVYPVYLSIQNPFDTRISKHREMFNEEFYGKYGNMTPLDPIRKLPDWTDAEALKEWIEENNYTFDGLILAESHGRITYAIFHPNQVKSVFNKGTWNKNSNNIMESFIKSFKRPENECLIEAILNGYKNIFESDDSFNINPNNIK